MRRGGSNSRLSRKWKFHVRARYDSMLSRRNTNGFRVMIRRFLYIFFVLWVSAAFFSTVLLTS